jgi:DNA-directed RNA polymerase specialized sigma24 family protein
VDKEIAAVQDHMGVMTRESPADQLPLVGAGRGEIEVVYRRSYAAFLRVATGILGDEAEAADAVQDAFASALRSRRGFRRAGSVDGWLWRMVVNAARKRRIGRMGRPLHLHVGEVPGLSQSAGDVTLRALVAALPERQRLVLFLRYYADLDYRTIGGALGIRPGTVAATLSAAHRTIRAQLEETDD